LSAESSSAVSDVGNTPDKDSMQALSPPNRRREAFIGLIAPIGIDLDQVVISLSESLNRVKYKANPVRLTEIFGENRDWYPVEYTNELEKYQKYIAAGDKLCQESGRKDVLALYGIAKLEKYAPRGSLDDLPGAVVHIFRQIKRVEEIEALNQVYGRNILFVSCYAPRNDRISYLVKQMLKTERGTGKSKLESKALDIISIDEDERDNPYGQRVVECYPKADYVLDCSSHASLIASADRLVEVFFGSPFVSPRVDEYASYIANAASYRSLDLSRQVGAAIFGPDKEVISLGCNEVPRAGGGTYWGDKGSDARDYALGYDSNQRVRDDMARDALVRLQKSGWLNSDLAEKKPDDLVALAFEEGQTTHGPLALSMIKDVIEFGRMVHAEMNALADAARFRRSTIGATLYCTTMPCHMCAKLIIASGIERVVYVQPYNKSLVAELFEDSVTVDEKVGEKRVTFDSLKGVTPNGFKRAFHKTKKRKEDDGTAKRWNPTTASPTFSSTFPYYVSLETKAKEDLKLALRMIAKLHPTQTSMSF
jgi:deoxycytidylate deaminase